MVSGLLYRTGLPMVDLFFNSFATMIEMQRAFVLGGMMTAPVSSKPKAPLQPEIEIAREASKGQEVETARDTGVKVQERKRAQAHPAVRRARRIRAARAAVSEKSRGRAVAQNPVRRKSHPRPDRETKRKTV